jgi:hypothetical protein
MEKSSLVFGLRKIWVVQTRNAAPALERPRAWGSLHTEISGIRFCRVHNFAQECLSGIVKRIDFHRDLGLQMGLSGERAAIHKYCLV